MLPFASYLVERAAQSFDIVPTYPSWNPWDSDGPDGFSQTSQPDDFLYHCTLEEPARRILASGTLIKGKAPLAGRNMRANSRGRVFLTDRNGVNFWYEKVWFAAVMTGKYNFRHPPVRVLRVPKKYVPNIMPDDIGTREAGAPAWYVEGGFSL